MSRALAKRLQYHQKLMNGFWKQWHAGYLKSLTRLKKWYKIGREIRKGGIDHASRCSNSKRTKYRKLHILLELEEFFLSFGFLETSKRGFIFAAGEGTWIEVLRGGCFANYLLYCNASC